MRDLSSTHQAALVEGFPEGLARQAVSSGAWIVDSGISSVATLYPLSSTLFPTVNLRLTK
jgi:hypothetical protein